MDVGTGSGAIALALASEGRFERVIGTDVSLDALGGGARERRRAARRCCARRWSCAHGSLLGAGAASVRCARSSRTRRTLRGTSATRCPPSVRDWEPAVALFSGADGMATTARLVREAARSLGAGGLLALEVDARRASLVAELVATDGAYEQCGWSWISPAASGSWSPDDGRRRDDRGQGEGARATDRTEPRVPGGEARERRAQPGPAAVALLKQMEQLRVDAQQMIQRGERPTEEMEKELDALLGQVQSQTAYQRLVSAQENFDKLMARVNDWIVDGIEKGATSSIITLG